MLEVRIVTARPGNVTFTQRVSTYRSAAELVDRVDRDLSDAMKNPLWANWDSAELHISFWRKVKRKNPKLKPKWVSIPDPRIAQAAKP